MIERLPRRAAALLAMTGAGTITMKEKQEVFYVLFRVEERKVNNYKKILRQVEVYKLRPRIVLSV